jgi:coproporphyrinogen III oxidase-like Fe-S oxidoreductase
MLLAMRRTSSVVGTLACVDVSESLVCRRGARFPAGAAGYLRKVTVIERSQFTTKLTRLETRKSGCRYGHMFDEQEIYLEDIIDALRANEGKLFRAVVKKLLNDDSADSTRVAESLMQHPDLRHLIAH